MNFPASMVNFSLYAIGLGASTDPGEGTPVLRDRNHQPPSARPTRMTTPINARAIFICPFVRDVNRMAAFSYSLPHVSGRFNWIGHVLLERRWLSYWLRA